MWACVKGHTDAAVLLYQWNNDALRICNKDGTKPLDVAQHHGHHELVQHIERLTVVQCDSDLGTVIKDDTAIDSSVLMPGDVSQALAVERFAVPRAVLRQTGNVLDRRTKTSTETGWSASEPSSTENLTIEIPNSPLLPGSLERSRPFCSAQNTPNIQHSTESGMSLSSVFVGSTDILCGQNVSGTRRRSRLMKRTSVEVLPDFPPNDVPDGTKCTKMAESKPTSRSMQNVHYESTSQSECAKSDDHLSQHEDNSHIRDSQSELPTDMTSLDSCPVRMSSVLLHSANSDPHIPTADTEANIRNTPPNPADGRSNSCADPMISMCDRDLNSPLMFLHMDSQQSSYETGLTLDDSVVMETGKDVL